MNGVGRQGKYIDDQPLLRHQTAIMAPSNEITSSATFHTHIKKASNALNTPPVATPPRSTTPPPATEKRKSERKSNEENVARGERTTGAELVDPNALSKALMKEFEDAGRHRDVTPGGSPSRKRQRVYGDR